MSKHTQMLVDYGNGNLDRDTKRNHSNGLQFSNLRKVRDLSLLPVYAGQLCSREISLGRESPSRSEDPEQV